MTTGPASFDVRAVHAVYQPIADLLTGAPVAFEALARGPAESPYHAPDVMFATAAERGQLPELDWACRAAAFRGALSAGLDRDLPLFVNTEPAALDTACPPDLLDAVDAAHSRLRVVSEFTERDLAGRPAGLLAAAASARQRGWGVALDDVGTEPASLALLPLVHPDVVKLDRRLIQQRSDSDVAGIVTAVLSYAESSGAAILAEGIETDEHRAVALAYGATLGQGWLFGRPGPLPAPLPRPALPVPTLAPIPAGSTPFEAISAARPTRRAEKRLLLGLSHHLENAAHGLSGATVVLSCFQHARHFTPATRRRYAQLADAAVLVGAIGSDLAAEPAPGVRGAHLRPGDPLADEWTVLVVGPHYAAGLIARDCGDGGPDQRRRFDYCVTHDRPLVLAAATVLMSRLLPAGTLPVPPQPERRAQPERWDGHRRVGRVHASGVGGNPSA